MNALALTLGATIVGCTAHAILLRSLMPRRHLLMLPMLLLGALSISALLMPLPEGPIRLEDGVVALVLTLSLGFAYALLIVGVVYDSPTLALVNTIEGYGMAGMPSSEFDAFVTRHPFLRSRLDALVAAGELSVRDGGLELTGKAVYLLSIGDAYRRLRGSGMSETG
jgi:hypothetical protein